MARFSKTQSWMRVLPFADAAMTAKKGRLSILRPGKGMGWTLSLGAMRVLFLIRISTRRVFLLLEKYSSDNSKFSFIFLRVSSSISRNSIGARLMVISELVTILAAMKLMASIGSSLGWYSISWEILAWP